MKKIIVFLAAVSLISIGINFAGAGSHSRCISRCGTDLSDCVSDCDNNGCIRRCETDYNRCVGRCD